MNSAIDEIEALRRRMTGEELDLDQFACHLVERQLKARIVRSLLDRADQEHHAMLAEISHRLSLPPPVPRVEHGYQDGAFDDVINEVVRQMWREQGESGDEEDA